MRLQLIAFKSSEFTKILSINDGLLLSLYILWAVRLPVESNYRT